MATLTSSSNEKVYSIKQFLGLNEHRDGDVKLKFGEASVSRNWKVTRDGSLQRRPGLDLLVNIGDAPVQGLWSGWVDGYEVLLGVCDGAVCSIDTVSMSGYEQIGTVHKTNSVHMFGFAGKVYFLDGESFKEWDGTTFKEVEGYIPLVAHAIGPKDSNIDGGELLEQVNKLTPKRRVWISGNGTGKVYAMPEKGFSGVTVTRTDTGAAVSGVTVNSEAGEITFNTAPEDAENVYEIQYTMPADQRKEVTAMRFTEIFAGQQDNRVVFYGDGTNELFFSEIDYWGQPRADYIPDLGEIAIGEANTPVTSVIRHYGRLVVFKNNSTWNVSISSITHADGDVEAAFYITPVNRAIGNEAPGQAQLILNSPRTIFRKELYEWKSNNSFSGNLTADERQAVRISDRIYLTLGSFRAEACICFDDNANQEYYICYNKTALVHNYVANAWYVYENFDARHFASKSNTLYIGNSKGDILFMSNNAPGDYVETINGVKSYEPIDAYWESGAVDFGADYIRKYSSVMWVTVKPEHNSFVAVSAMTDKKEDFATKEIRRGSSGGFSNWSFSALSFTDNTQPFVKKLRMKAKKFVYYKLILKNAELNSTGTVLCIDIRCRTTGYAK